MKRENETETRKRNTSKIDRCLHFCGEFGVKAHVTGHIPGCATAASTFNQVASGAPALPDAALGLFHFTVGKAAYEAMVEVAAA